MRLIDADGLINDIEELITEHEEMMRDGEEHPGDYPEDYKTRVLNLIAGLITAKVEVAYAPIIQANPVKHGKWVRIEIKGIINPLTGGNRTYTGCSCCGEPIPTDSILDIIPEEEVNFCFGCGAKMDKEKEE